MWMRMSGLRLEVICVEWVDHSLFVEETWLVDWVYVACVCVSVWL